MTFTPTRILGLATAGAALASCTTIAEIPTARVGQATLSYANGLPAGTVQLVQSGAGLAVVVTVTGMTPGAHGFHLHTAGKCEGPEFTSAGGHLNPAGRKHGTLAGSGPHLGDLPNLEVGANGGGAGRFDVPGAAATALDDYRTDPTGNSGARIACGVLSRAG
jgi:superoxide dismutase, Cu-Zn family